MEETSSHESHRSHPAPRAWVFIGRALRLRCPECGISPMFVPMRRVRSLWDYFRPLDGCPRCGYAYEREQGYFLLATWGVNYGIVAGLGIIVALAIDHWTKLSLAKACLLVLPPMAVLSMLLARHAKAMFCAMDHYFDPHVK